MIDTHCHLTSKPLNNQLNPVLQRAAEAGVDRMITVGTSAADSAASCEIAARHENIYFTTGVQPHFAAETTADHVAALESLLRHPKCVAFGEIGLDYHYPEPAHDVQAELFEAQLRAHRQWSVELPVVIHSRKATDDTLAILWASGIALDRFVFHCFTEPPEDCRKVLDAGCMISFTGIATYKNAADVQASAKLVPTERIMLETDAPYLSPEPHRKIRPNEPWLVTAVGAFLAELRGEDRETFIVQCDANAERFYELV